MALSPLRSRRAAPPIDWANTRDRFGFGAQLFHAVIGMAVLAMLALGLSLSRWPQAYQPYAILVHKGLGLWILGLSVAWLVHWLFQPSPAPVPGQTWALHRLATLTHRVLLLLCVIMPLSGWAMASAWGDAAVSVAPYIRVPALIRADPDLARALLGLHILLSWFLMGALALHLAGVLYHRVIRRDSTLRRMIPRLRQPNDRYRAHFRDGVERSRRLR